MKSSKQNTKNSKSSKRRTTTSKLRSGDKVMVISGGNKNKRVLKGQTGSIVRMVGSDRAIVDGLNKVTRHQRATGVDKPSGKIEREAAIHISNLMYYAEKIEKPVRLRFKNLSDGRKVRGYLDPKSQEFVQVDS